MSKQSLQISVHHYTDMLYTSIKGAQSMTLYSSRRLMNFWFFGKTNKTHCKTNCSWRYHFWLRWYGIYWLLNNNFQNWNNGSGSSLENPWAIIVFVNAKKIPCSTGIMICVKLFQQMILPNNNRGLELFFKPWVRRPSQASKRM